MIPSLAISICLRQLVLVVYGVTYLMILIKELAFSYLKMN